VRFGIEFGPTFPSRRTGPLTSLRVRGQFGGKRRRELDQHDAAAQQRRAADARKRARLTPDVRRLS